MEFVVIDPNVHVARKAPSVLKVGAGVLARAWAVGAKLYDNHKAEVKRLRDEGIAQREAELAQRDRRREAFESARGRFEVAARDRLASYRPEFAGVPWKAVGDGKVEVSLRCLFHEVNAELLRVYELYLKPALQDSGFDDFWEDPEYVDALRDALCVAAVPYKRVAFDGVQDWPEGFYYDRKTTRFDVGWLELDYVSDGSGRMKWGNVWRWQTFYFNPAA